MIQELCKKCKSAVHGSASAGGADRNAVLTELKALLLSSASALIAENAKDLKIAAENGKNSAFLDRLALNSDRIKGMANGLDDIIKLPYPVGEVVDSYVRPNGLRVEKVRSPLGVIGIIFEARPNVAIDASALCIKSGNGVVLRGSRDSRYSVAFLVELIKKALASHGISQDAICNIEGADRAITTELLKQDKYIDVVIPRGGEALKKAVLSQATMPVIASSGGNCHQYIAESANEDMAIAVAINAKISRPSTCNALETLLISANKSPAFVKKVVEELQKNGVEVRGSEAVNAITPVKVIDSEEFYIEYNDMIIKLDIVADVTEAIVHINEYSTHHSEAIISSDEAECQKFCAEVDSAAVYVNASTRFTDGFELGLGAEMGISTQKLHVRGPIGLTELTSVRYIVTGDYTIRK
ncbi:MAG: glutamate-5-semialdehyde dehydrogenase [Bacillota bacterium]